MKTLYLLRHAKSSWAVPTLGDFDRPLNRRGEKAAPRMAAHMRDKAWQPELVLCSAAVRARQTWELASSVLQSHGPVKYLRGLYLASPSVLLRVIRRQDDDRASLLLIGHNPGLENLVALLAGPGSARPALRAFRQKFPTAALAVISFEVAHWNDLREGEGRLTHFVTPRELKS